MNNEQAMLELGETTANAVVDVLSSLCPDGAERGRVSAMPDGASALESLTYPTIATDVAYTGGVTGGNLFTITRLGARRLAATMMFAEPPTEDERDLDEIEMSALGEAMNQMMAASAAALAGALGYPVEISVPTTRVLQARGAADGAYPQTPYATRVSFTVLGEGCQLIQLIPNAFVVRMARALDGSIADSGEGTEEGAGAGLSAALRDIPVRVSAELGRAMLSLEQVADPTPGVVIELDRSCEDPVDLCVNGKPFAMGELLLVDEGEWAMRIERVLDVNPADFACQPAEGT